MLKRQTGVCLPQEGGYCQGSSVCVIERMNKVEFILCVMKLWRGNRRVKVVCKGRKGLTVKLTCSSQLLEKGARGLRALSPRLREYEIRNRVVCLNLTESVSLCRSY